MERERIVNGRHLVDSPREKLSDATVGTITKILVGQLATNLWGNEAYKDDLHRNMRNGKQSSAEVALFTPDDVSIFEKMSIEGDATRGFYRLEHNQFTSSPDFRNVILQLPPNEDTQIDPKRKPLFSIMHQYRDEKGIARIRWEENTPYALEKICEVIDRAEFFPDLNPNVLESTN